MTYTVHTVCINTHLYREDKNLWCSLFIPVTFPCDFRHCVLRHYSYRFPYLLRPFAEQHVFFQKGN